MAKPLKKKPVKKPAPKPSKSSQSGSTEEKENPFDFGGLPSRDFKKNLGCG
jgi:hypothetical protein